MSVFTKVRLSGAELLIGTYEYAYCIRWILIDVSMFHIYGTYTK